MRRSRASTSPRRRRSPAQNQLEVARQTLAQIIGKQPEPLAGLREGVALQRPQPENIADWVAAAESGSFGVQAQQLAREIAAREVERARAGHLPTVDIVASHGVNNRPQLSTDALRGDDDRPAAERAPVRRRAGVLGVARGRGAAHEGRCRPRGCAPQRCARRAPVLAGRRPAAWRRSRRWKRRACPRPPRSTPTSSATRSACASTSTC